MDAKTFKDIFSKQTSTSNADTIAAAQSIIDTVKADGDKALYDYTEKFDGQKLDTLKVSPERLKASWEALDEDLQDGLKLAKQRIEAYEETIKYEDVVGEELSYVYHPLQRVGVYIPGGTALYPSSVLMTIVPALVAGVEEIVVTTPVFEETSITFAALYLLGVTENVYAVGGAQAIAALAYGTESIPKVDKIFGPGNAYVAAAKRLVNGDVGIDSIAGPSEILLYVDDSVDVDAVVYDVFAQAEHDVNARTFLLTEDQKLADTIETRIEELVNEQERADIIRESVINNHYVVVDTRENLIDTVNLVASEHVSVQHRDQDEIVEAIKFAGAVFKGYYSMEAIGDYMAGPSHVLPTGQSARFSSGLNVNTFRTGHAVIHLKEDTFKKISPAAERIANAEGLYAHEKSMAVRRDD